MEEKFYELLDSVRKTAVSAGETASNAAYAVGKKAEALLGTARLNMEILDRRGAVRDAMREVGEMVYATHIGADSSPDVLLEKLQAIDVLKAEIAEMEIAAGKAERVRTCRACGTEAKAGDVFCRACGEKL